MFCFLMSSNAWGPINKHTWTALLDDFGKMKRINVPPHYPGPVPGEFEYYDDWSKHKARFNKDVGAGDTSYWNDGVRTDTKGVVMRAGHVAQQPQKRTDTMLPDNDIIADAKKPKLSLSSRDLDSPDTLVLYKVTLIPLALFPNQPSRVHRLMEARNRQ